MMGRPTTRSEHRLSLFVFLGLSAAVGLAFCGLYALLTHPDIHRGLMLALGGYNYENTAAGYANIRRVMAPYAVPDTVRLLSWDAHTYHRIATEGYSAEHFWMTAFFPWFPTLWGTLQLPVTLLPVLHFSIFSLGMAVLFTTFGSRFTPKVQVLLYLGLMVLPSFTIMYMPYPEAWSFLFLSLALRAIMRGQNYTLFFWMLCYATTRPNVLLLGCALLGWAMHVFWHERRWYLPAFRPMLWSGAGVAVGLLLVFGWYAYKTGSFFIFFEAQKVWNTQLQWPEQWSDWSIEMKGLNLSLVMLGGVVAIISLLRALHRGAWRQDLFASLQVWAWWAWLGIALHVMVFQGGNLHSAHRYLMAQPLFVLLVLGWVERVSTWPNWTKWVVWATGLGCTAWLLAGLGKIKYFHLFESGPYWWMVVGGLWIFFMTGKWRWYKVVGFGVWCLAGLLYQTFLWNVFLSRGWIWA